MWDNWKEHNRHKKKTEQRFDAIHAFDFDNVLMGDVKLSISNLTLCIKEHNKFLHLRKNMLMQFK